MKKTLAVIAIFGVGIFMTACDWTSGGGVDSWNSRYNWVNFSGVYRGIGGGVLVTDFSVTPGTPGSTNTVSESAGTTDGDSVVYRGRLNRRPVVAGSVTIAVVGFVTFEDDGSGTLTGSIPNAQGAIDHGTGAWSIDLPFAPRPGAEINITYQYTVAGTEGDGSAGPGSSGAAIRSFTVFQEGETLRITDNNGALYKGKFGSVRTTGGEGATGRLVSGETIVAQFTARGTSAAGVEVRMTGTFQGVVGGVSAAGDSGSLANRQMFGTWIEPGGRTGDINGQSAPIPVTMETTSRQTTPQPEP